MSDGKEVKRWTVHCISDGETNCVDEHKIVKESDHDRIVAELRAEVEALRGKAGIANPYLVKDALIKKHEQTIATQERVIEKLKVALEDVLHERYSDDDVSAVSSDPLMILLTAIENGKAEG